MVQVTDDGGLDRVAPGDTEESRQILVMFWRQSQLNLLFGCGEKEKDGGRFPGF